MLRGHWFDGSSWLEAQGQLLGLDVSHHMWARARELSQRATLFSLGELSAMIDHCGDIQLAAMEDDWTAEMKIKEGEWFSFGLHWVFKGRNVQMTVYS